MRTRATPGLDLAACERGASSRPGERAVVPTGLAVAIPEGYAGFVQPRSGLAARHGIAVVNSPGPSNALRSAGHHPQHDWMAAVVSGVLPGQAVLHEYLLVQPVQQHRRRGGDVGEHPASRRLARGGRRAGARRQAMYAPLCTAYIDSCR